MKKRPTMRYRPIATKGTPQSQKKNGAQGPDHEDFPGDREAAPHDAEGNHQNVGRTEANPLFGPPSPEKFFAPRQVASERASRALFIGITLERFGVPVRLIRHRSMIDFGGLGRVRLECWVTRVEGATTRVVAVYQGPLVPLMV